MTPRPKCRKALACALIVGPLAAGLTACGGGSNPLAAAPYDAGDQVVVNADAAEDGGRVDSREPLEVTASGSGSRITDVLATDAAGRRLAGKLSSDGDRWRSTSPLAAGVRYTVVVSTENGDGAPGSRTLRFQTKPADGRRLGVTFGPERGTYGVGQPLVAELSHRMRGAGERRTVERALRVESTPRTEGAWHWVDGRTLHYRPKGFWPTHATVTVSSSLGGVGIRDGLRGGDTRPLTIRTGARVEALVDMSAHTMSVRRNGKHLRTLPVTTGKSGFETRNGTKVVLGKQPFIRMQGTSIGIPEGSSESYDLPVHWNTQVTRSGEFVHAAPWSTGSQGSANVSHGCTGMSTANARWFYELVRRGDVVRYVNGSGDRMDPFDNGFGDWNLSWAEWRRGSALTGGADAEHVRNGPGRLRFES
ncbi:Ig-like domain-containing protein [Streptomyces sp. NPDC054784]